MNTLSLLFKATDCNGMPSFAVTVNNATVYDNVAQHEDITVDVTIPNTATEIVINRYGKTDNNIQLDGSAIIKDQVLELVSISVDGVKLPHWFLWEHVILETQGHKTQSLVMGPNGTWTIEFPSPLISCILDKKINHEAKYNQDYIYPWSYKLGPDSVAEVSRNINTALNIVNSKL